MIGPVGFAETISTWTRSRRSGEPAAVAVARLEDLAERLAEPGGREPEVDEARPGDLGALDLVAARRPSPASSSASSRGGGCCARREPERDVRRVVAVLGGRSAARARPARRRARSARLEPRDGVSRQRPRAGRTAPRAPQLVGGADRDHHVADLERRVRARASCRRCRPACAARRSRRRSARGCASSRIVLPAWAQVSVTSISSNRRSGPPRRRDDVEERRDLRAQHELRHLLAGGRVRLHDAVGAREQQLRRPRPRRTRARRSAGRAARCAPRA